MCLRCHAAGAEGGIEFLITFNPGLEVTKCTFFCFSLWEIEHGKFRLSILLYDKWFHLFTFQKDNLINLFYVVSDQEWHGVPTEGRHGWEVSLPRMTTP